MILSKARNTHGNIDLASAGRWGVVGPILESEMTTAAKVVEHLKTCDLSRVRHWSTAKALAMSDTTMRRSLATEGTSFTELLKAERVRRFQSMPDAGGKQIAAALGYNELNSFYRAFKQWFGQNYRDYKRELSA